MKNTIYVEHKNFVSVKDQSLCFKNVIDKTEKYIPFEDLGMIIFDNVDSYFTSSVVTTCIEENVGILFCGKNHTPIAEINSNYNHNKKLERLKLQLTLSQKTKNRLWKKIVVSKIVNQNDCLLNITADETSFNMLVSISKEVQEGDSSNRESYAAILYFIALFGKDFRRGRYTDVINAGLNYGYAILRSAIRKELAIFGFEMSIGIFHRSSENPFNLSDDLIEPFRPFVDAIVYEEILSKNISELTKEIRIKLINVLFVKCIIDDKVYCLNDAIRVCVSSLIECYEKDSAKYLKLPSLIEVGP